MIRYFLFAIEIASIKESIMSEVNKDNKEFEFIKEQVLPKKLKKLRRWLLPFLMTIVMAVIFGVVAALTFCLSEPRIHDLLYKDDPNPFVIPSSAPNKSDNGDDIKDKSSEDSSGDKPTDSPDNKPGHNPTDHPMPTEAPDNDSSGEQTDKTEKPDSVIIQPVNADINDYLSMYNEIKTLSDEIRKSILTVSSIIVGKDWFGNPIEKRIYTSGIIVANNGTNIMLLVSQDRVKDASSIMVEINETTYADAVLHDYEDELNLAVISINTSNIPKKVLDNLAVAQLGESYSITVGNPIIAMGSPNGYPGSVDLGIITSKGSVISITDYELDLFNTNMVFNNESDGILVNFKGEIIGLITRTLKDELNKELSTAVGISKVKSYIDRMISQTPRIYTGIIAENMPQTDITGQTGPRGVYVYEVKKDSPAFNAGLMSGDIILNVGDRMISSMDNYYNAISNYEPGTEVIFKVKRISGTSDKDIELKVVLEAKK
jgi:S1-C subfamily serine protease